MPLDEPESPCEFCDEVDENGECPHGDDYAEDCPKWNPPIETCVVCKTRLAPDGSGVCSKCTEQEDRERYERGEYDYWEEERVKQLMEQEEEKK
jgi:hypothetical protein